MSQKLLWLFIILFIGTYAIGQTPVFHNEWIDYNKTYYKFKVMGFGLDTNNVPLRSGIVRIPYATIAAAGLLNTSAEHFQLWRDGNEIPVWVSNTTGPLGASDYIEFVGEINNGKLDNEMYRNPDFQLNNKWSFQTDTASYFLTVNTAGNNKRYSQVSNNVSANILPADSFFMYTTGRYFRNISNGFAASLGQNLYSSSYDRGEGFVSRAVKPVGGACGATTLIQPFVRLYPYASGPQMTLKVNAVGDAQNSRKFRIDINGDSIATYQMDYINYVKAIDYAAVSKISSGNANIAIVDQSPALCDEMRVGMIELTYPRKFNFDGKTNFSFTLDSSSTGRYLTIVNFNHGGVAPVLYDTVNKKRYITDISRPDTIKVLLDPSVAPYELMLTTQSGNYYKNITTVLQRNFINYAAPANQGNYLIISNPLIYGTGSSNYVEQYKDYRSSVEGGSYNAKLVDINELTDQFAFGTKKHPLAIKKFLRYARTNFVDSPKFVFIIGKGVIYNEYRTNEANASAERLNLVPTWGNPASDNLLASDGIIALPATPIGRLSAISAQEVGDYLKKVKQHDSLQRSTVYTIASKGWMKNVLQITGASDLTLGGQIDGYLQNYKSIIADTSFGANVTSFSKTADPAGYSDAVISFKKIYESGASLITYFGHSSNTSLDFNLDNPATYNNKYKYPIFIANGCSAGNHFLFETNRFNSKSTISEKFILSPERGSIGYLASTHFGVINYLDKYTNNFYKALGQTKYNQSIGEVIQESIRSTLAATGNSDYFSRVHAEQYAFHGDPAIKLNAAPLADYVIETPQMQVTPSFVSTADTSFSVKVKVHNIGKATRDSVTFNVTRINERGESFFVAAKIFPSILLVDSVTINVPIIGNRDYGVNKITATVDFDNTVNELSDSNNTASIDVIVSDDEITPVYPYKYAIINQPNTKLFASTVNPVSVAKEYLLELDTTALFNSPVKVSKSNTTKGGIVEFDPAITFTDSTTYYWRVAPATTTGEPHWLTSSFVYKSTSNTGFQQGHLYEHLQSSFSSIKLDSASRNYAFTPKLHNLFIINSVYPTSGTEDNHFSISVDGSSIIESACVGSSIIFNVFDSLTFTPFKNLTQPYGAAPACAPTRQYNFEYQYTTAQSRKNALNFLDSLPNGSYVSARLIIATPYNSFADQWAADTLINGKGNSLYHRLKQFGFSGIDSFNYPRTWSFVFRKGDSTFTPAWALSEGLYDRITLSVDCATTNTQGEISSPVFGPAKEWKTIFWNGNSNEVGNDIPTISVYGIRRDNSDSLLHVLDSATQTLDISSVNALQFPFIRLKMNNKDSVTATPYQLKKWGVEYIAVPEGAVAPNLYFNIPDTVSTFGSASFTDTLHAGFAFKNVSKANFDSLSIKVVLYDSVNNAINYPQQKLRALPAGDTLHVDLDLDVTTLSGWYNLHVIVNPSKDQPEQYSFNNFLYKYVYIDKGRVMPVTLVDFNAVMQEKLVKTTWTVTAEKNVKQYEVQHSIDGVEFKKVGSVQASTQPSYKYFFLHQNPNRGRNYYRLRIIDNDGTFKFSPVRLVTLLEEIVINVYPNPVTDILNISINTVSDSKPNVTILNTYGQVLWQQNVSRSAQVNTRKWASGMYIIKVVDGDKTNTIKIQKQ